MLETEVKEIEIGDLVYLKSDPEFLFNVVDDMEKVISITSPQMSTLYKGYYNLTAIDKKNNKAIELKNIHKDTFVVVKKSKDF